MSADNRSTDNRGFTILQQLGILNFGLKNHGYLKVVDNQGLTDALIHKTWEN